MQNVKVRLDGDKLLIEVDTKHTAYDTGKAEMVATTQGWEPLHEVGLGNLAISMNVTRKKRGDYHRKGDVV